MHLLWLLIFDRLLFPEQLDHSHAIALDFQNQHLKAQCKDFFSFNSLQVLALRNNFPGWDCLLFSGPLARGELAEVEEN